MAKLSISTGTYTTNSTSISTASYAVLNSVLNTSNSILSYLEDKSINLAKIEEMTAERRTTVLSIISSLSSATEKSVRIMLLNTLESYNILEDKEVIERKSKIESFI